MQQIERYGVIALLFLLVTIVVVALWDGGDPAHAGAGADPAAEQQAKAPERQGPSAVERERADRRARPNTDRSLRPEDRRQANRQNARQNPNQNPNQNLRRVTLDPNRGNRTGQPDARRRTAGGTGSQAPVYQDPGAAARIQQDRIDRASANGAGVSPGFTPSSREAGSTVRFDDSGRRAQAQRTNRPVRTERQETSLVRTPSQPVTQKRPVASARTYRVQPGDSLERIARRQLGDGQRWKEIQVLNGIARPEAIAVGAVLKLPAGAAPQAAARNNTSASNRVAQRSNQRQRAQGASTYTVQPGDVLTRIAQKELGSAKRYKEIVAANPGLNPDRLIVGKVLKMPTGKATKRSAAGKARNQPVKNRSQDERYVVH